MDVALHKKEFDRINKQYNLATRAHEIADFLTSQKKVPAEKFAELFGLTEKDAILFLSFIQRGITFKEKHIDRK